MLNFEIFFNQSEIVSKSSKIISTGAFQKVKFQKFLQPWWNNDYQKAIKLIQSGVFQNIEFQHLQPWWSTKSSKIVSIFNSFYNQGELKVIKLGHSEEFLLVVFSIFIFSTDRFKLVLNTIPVNFLCGLFCKI